MRKSTIAIGVAAALSTQAFVTTTNADAAVKNHPQKASGPVHSQPHFVLPHHSRPTGGSVLFDQSGSPVNGAPSQNFESAFDAFDAQGADDFVVTDAAGWTVSAFNFQISPSISPPGDPTTATYDIEVFSDAGGVPSATAVCSYPTAAGVVDPGITSLSVSLPSACVLPQGTYWISMVVNLDFGVGGQLFWSDNSSGSGFNSKWQNPGGGFGSGCATWSDLATCVSSLGSPVGGGQTAFLFQVVGAIGGGGGGCGAGDLCLVSTVGTDTTAGACGTEDTIDVTQGDQVNFCYTITNNTGVELDYHTLQNNVDGTIFSLLNEPVAPGASFQYNKIETVGATATYNSTWTGQDVPPGYAAEVTTGGGGDCTDRIFADGFDGSTPPCPGGNFVDITSTGTPLNLFDDQSVGVTMPFSFNFYGTTANTLCVDNNGFVLFNTTNCPSGGHFTNTSLPGTSLSAPAFMPLWDDFDSESGNIYTDTRGTTPNRQFIVEWFDRFHYQGTTNTDGATFELILNEDGTIQFEYDDVEYSGGLESGNCNGGICATIGLQNDQSLFNQFSAFEASVTDDSGIKWTATTPQIFTGTDSATVNVGAPQIVITPSPITGSVPAGGSSTIPFTVGNTGDRDLNWSLTEAGPADLHFPPAGPRFTMPMGDPATTSNRPVPLALRHPSSKGTQHSLHVPLGVPGVPVFAADLYNSNFETFDALDPGNTTTVAPTDGTPWTGGAFIDGDFSKLYIISGNFAGNPDAFASVDTATGAVTPIGFADSGGAGWNGMAYDTTSGTLYAVAGCGSGSTLYTIDVNTGASTQVANLANETCSIAIAFDPDGNMYSVDIIDDSLYAVDKTNGNDSAIGSIGFDANFAQDMAFDQSTGVLYLAGFDRTLFTDSIYTLDLIDGHSTLIGGIGPSTQEVDAMGIETVGGPCAQPQDLPWLSLSPLTGTTTPGSTTPVTASIDGTGTSDGDVLSGTVCAASNDPDDHTLATPITVTVGTGGGTGSFPPDENFDEVTAPALPTGWTTAASGLGVPWVTVSDAADTAPNAAFSADEADVSDATMDSPAFTPVANQTVTFKHQYDLEHGSGTTAFDGAVLEISIGGGAFQDVIAAGGSFVSGGYDSTVSTCCSNPLAGRAAWSGASAGFVTTEINLPASAVGQPTVLRFRVASDDSFAESGWWVDTIHLDVGGGSTCTQLMQDPSFEASLSGSGPWDSTSTNFGTALCDATGCGTGGGTAGPHSGSVWAWLGGAGGIAETATVSQSVVVPSGDPRFLNFWMWIGAIGPGGGSVVTVTVDGSTVATFPEPGSPEAGYSQHSIDVSSVADGSSHTFEFSYTIPGNGLNSNFNVDDVTLDCEAPPIQPALPLGHPQPANTSRTRN